MNNTSLKSLLILCFFTFSLIAHAQTNVLGLNNSYCKNEPAFSLAGFGTPAGGSFTIDGIAATLFDPSLLTAENHTIVYTFTDGEGIFNTITQIIEVKAAPNAPYSVHFFDCGNTRPKAHSTPYGVNQTFEWYFNANHTGDVIPSQRAFDGANEISLLDNITNYCGTCTTVVNKTYYVFEVGANGCYSPPTEVPITVFPLPKTLPDVTNTFGCGNKVLVSANGHGNIVEWRTSFNSLAGTTLATGETYTATQNESIWAVEVSEYPFTLTKPLPVSETTLRCYGAATQVDIILKPTPPAPTVDNISLCVGDAPKPIYTNPNYIWFSTVTGGTQTGSPVTIQTDIPSNNTYYIAQIVDFCPSTERTEMHATVQAPPSTPSVLSLIQPTCNVLTGTITLNIQEGVTYSFDDGVTFQISNEKTSLTAGLYKIKVKNDNGCISPPLEVTINTVTTNTTAYNIIASNATVCVGETVKLSVSPTSTTCSYLWNNGKTTPLIYVTPLISTTYTVTVSQNGCTTVLSTSITVNQKPVKPILTIMQPTCTALGTITITNLPAGAFSKINGQAWVLGKTIYNNLSADEYVIKIRLNECESSKEVSLTLPNFTFDPTKCYKIVNKNSGKVLDVFENKTANSTPIIQYNFTNNSNQKWQFSTLANGFMKIKVQNSGKFLACHDNYNGANVYQYDYYAGGQKDWKIECLGNGDYRILHKYSSKYLSVENNAQANKAKIEIRNWANINAQKWQIVEVPCSNTVYLQQANVLTANAESEPQQVKILWHSNLGEKMDYYSVEKMDAETAQFSTIKTLNNPHFDNEMHTFTLHDAQPTEGVNVYRIKAVFNDGSSQLSEILKAVFGDIKAVRLYPNPTTDFMDIQLPKMPKGEVILQLNNMLGRVVAEKKFEATQTLHFEIGDVPNGLYQLNINEKGKRRVVQHVVIQK